MNVKQYKATSSKLIREFSQEILKYNIVNRVDLPNYIYPDECELSDFLNPIHVAKAKKARKEQNIQRKKNILMLEVKLIELYDSTDPEGIAKTFAKASDKKKYKGNKEFDPIYNCLETMYRRLDRNIHKESKQDKPMEYTNENNLPEEALGLVERINFDYHFKLQLTDKGRSLLNKYRKIKNKDGRKRKNLNQPKVKQYYLSMSKPEY